MKTFIVHVSVDAESEVRAKMILEHAIEVGAKEGCPDAEQDEVAVVLESEPVEGDRIQEILKEVV